MEKIEILRYAELNGGIEIDRNYEIYPGLCRSIWIRRGIHDDMVHVGIEFFDSHTDRDDTGDDFFVIYPDYDSAIAELEVWLKKPLSDWTKQNFLDLQFPEAYEHQPIINKWIPLFRGIYDNTVMHNAVIVPEHAQIANGYFNMLNRHEMSVPKQQASTS